MKKVRDAVEIMTPLARRSAPRALGAIAGQVSQAAASLVLQVAAARSLGAEGLGLFALLYGVIVVGTAIASGLIGDSLTVLARHELSVRVALVRGAVAVAVLGGLAAFTVGSLSGQLTWHSAGLFGGAAAVFIAVDAMRRLLMASQRYWSLALVDLSSLVTSLVVLSLAHRLGGLSIAAFMLALLLGQGVAWSVAWWRLPLRERWLPCRGRAEVRRVLRFGAWRSLQLGVRPGTLMVFRLAVTLSAGLAAFGEVEAARVYMAPALIVVGGLGSFLMPMYVSRDSVGAARLVRQADRVAIALLLLVLMMGGVALLLLPWAGGVISGGEFQIDELTVGCWSAFAVATAALTPYTTLAAVRGRQSVVASLRVLEPAVSLLLLVPLLLLVGVAVAPLALAGGAAMAGIAVRRHLVLLTTDSRRPLA